MSGADWLLALIAEKTRQQAVRMSLCFMNGFSNADESLVANNSEDEFAGRKLRWKRLNSGVLMAVTMAPFAGMHKEGLHQPDASEMPPTLLSLPDHNQPVLSRLRWWFAERQSFTIFNGEDRAVDERATRARVEPHYRELAIHPGQIKISGASIW